MASTYLTKTMGNPPGNSRIGTFSFWIKFSGLSASGEKYLFSTYENGNNRSICKFNTDGAFEFQARSGGNIDLRYDTNKLFRDTNAWYNVVIATDTTQSTAADRVKIYVNGVQETSFSVSTVPSQNVVPHYLYGGIVRTIGAYGDGNTAKWDGLMSYVAFIDGTQELPTVFGETDATTGEWKIKTTITPSSAWGTNGYLILKDGNSVTDQSGQGNNFTVAGGTLTKTEDSPSNVFATLNPLVYNTSSKTYGFGNTAITSSPNNSGEWQSTQTTLGASTGKYYCEIKINAVGNYHTLGVGYQPNITNVTSTQNIGELSGSAGWRNNGQTGIGNSFDTGGNPSLNTYTTGDILGIAMDLTNSKLYFSKNGTWENSGVPTSGSTGTGSIRNLTAGEAYHFVIAPRGGSTYCNFGNGYFGSTQISSAGTNASGNGIFEYDVPTGYTALSTKGLNL